MAPVGVDVAISHCRPTAICQQIPTAFYSCARSPSASSSARPSGRAREQWLLPKVGGGSSFAAQLEDVQPGVGAIDDVDITPIVDLNIVGLDRDLALVLSIRLDQNPGERPEI